MADMHNPRPPHPYPQLPWKLCLSGGVELRYELPALFLLPGIHPAPSFIPAAKGELPFLPLPNIPPSHSIWNGVGILLYIRRDWGIFHWEGDETSGVGSSLPIKLGAAPEAED